MSAGAKNKVIEAPNEVLEEDMTELREVSDAVNALREEVRKFGRRLDTVDCIM